MNRPITIDVYYSQDRVDGKRLTRLLEASFERPLLRPLTDQDIDVIYLERRYRGAASVARLPQGAYLTKFAVDPKNRRQGIGHALFKRVLADHPKLFWRAHPSREITSWYARQSDGMCAGPNWNVYWIGFSPDEIAPLVAYAEAAPRDFSY